MTGQITVWEPALAQARSEVVDIHDELAGVRSRLSRRAADLVADGWQGPAAGQYARAWDDWEQASGDVLGALLALSTAMAVAYAELVAADTSVAAAASRLSARLGG